MLRKVNFFKQWFVEFVVGVFFKVALRVSLPWATEILKRWSKLPKDHKFVWSKMWRYNVSYRLQPLLAKLNGKELCLYCQSVLWGEPHDECDRQFAREQDLMDGGRTVVDYDLKEDPYKDVSEQPDCPAEPKENIPDQEEDDWEEEDEDSEWPDEDVDEEGASSLPPEHEPVFRLRACEGCGKQFETSNGSGFCYECTLKEICNGLPPEEGDYNTAVICSGSRQVQAVRAELKDYA